MDHKQLEAIRIAVTTVLSQLSSEEMHSLAVDAYVALREESKVLVAA